jgi:hypothetical protein
MIADRSLIRPMPNFELLNFSTDATIKDSQHIQNDVEISNWKTHIFYRMVIKTGIENGALPKQYMSMA